jgi:hypothetical protein
MPGATHPPDLTLTADVPSMFDSDGADRRVMVGRVRYPGIINSVEFIPAWALTGANTNSRTLTLYNRGTGGAGTTAIATLALTSGVDLARSVSETITITPANAAVVVGDILEWESLHVGTGLPDPGGKVIVQQAVTY